MKSSSLLFLLAGLLLLLLVPFVAGSYALGLVTKIMIFAILALSLELLVGTTGLVCFGQAALFGIGAYAAVLCAPADEPGSALLLAALGMLFGGAYALFMGALSLRTRGVYFIMVTLAFAQLAYYVIHDTPLGGGTDGIYLNTRPQAPFGLDLEHPAALYGCTLACLVIVYAALALLLRSPFGRALAGIRVNEQRMRATGFSTYPYKLAAFVISGAIAGLAGVLYAAKDAFVNPELLAWHQSGAVLVMIIFGGLGQLRGALVGAFAYVLLEELFMSEAVFGAYAKHWHLSLGLTIIACVALLPRGLVGIPSQIAERIAGRRAGREAGEDVA